MSPLLFCLCSIIVVIHAETEYLAIDPTENPLLVVDKVKAVSRVQRSSSKGDTRLQKTLNSFLLLNPLFRKALANCVSDARNENLI